LWLANGSKNLSSSRPLTSPELEARLFGGEVRVAEVRGLLQWLSVLPVDLGCVVFAEGQEFLQWHGQVSSSVVAGQGRSSG
jgi:hypothetical protein